MAGFIGLHAGAGLHSASLLENYKKLCNKACRKGISMLKNGNNALEVVTEVTAVLENSSLTNAGYGSTLTWDGDVECDASVMDGNTLLYGAVGAVSGVKNPVKLAQHLCCKQCGPSLALGRIAPSLLVGDGAHKWAEAAGIPTVPKNTLISGAAMKKYLKYKNRLQKFHSSNNQMMGPLETVGVVCVDKEKHVASACSSGGIALKHSGRIGQAAMYGCGCWAVDSRNSLPGIATCTSGCGEYLIRTCLAREVAEGIRTCEFCAIKLHDVMTSQFINSPFLRDVEVHDKLGGVIVLKYSPNENYGEFLWAHTTKTMMVSYVGIRDTNPKTYLSSLPETAQMGNVVNVEGITFSL